MFSSTVTTMKQQRGLLAVLVLQSVLLLLLQFPESCTAFVVPVTTTLLPRTSAALHISSADSDRSNDDSKKSTPTMASTKEDTSSALYSSSSTSADDKSDNSSTKNLNYFDKLFEEENDQIFQKYDIDNSGTIDKTEFKMVVKKMNKESRRRELFSIGSATLGSLFVASSSTTFQYGQKKLRSKYLEPKAELAMTQNFPTALLSGDCEKLIFKTLNSRGFTPTNTLLGHSVCSDEVNTRGEQIIPLMIDRWNKKGFALGGLAGLPFAGKSGFGAYLHHVPDDGKLLVIFAPHVGIDAEGQIGGLQRDGQIKVSSACGAAIGAYKALQSKKKTPDDPLLVYDNLERENLDTKFDPQLEQIVNLLAPRLKGIDDAQNSISFVTYQMYGIIRELITACITQTDDLFDYTTEIAVVGGVIINRRKGGDFFQPLSFETRKRCSSGDTKKIDTPIDLYEETFGPRPNIQDIMGSKQAIDRASIFTS